MGCVLALVTALTYIHTFNFSMRAVSFCPFGVPRLPGVNRQVNSHTPVYVLGIDFGVFARSCPPLPLPPLRKLLGRGTACSWRGYCRAQLDEGGVVHLTCIGYSGSGEVRRGHSEIAMATREPQGDEWYTRLP